MALRDSSLTIAMRGDSLSKSCMRTLRGSSRSTGQLWRLQSVGGSFHVLRRKSAVPVRRSVLQPGVQGAEVGKEATRPSTTLGSPFERSDCNRKQLRRRGGRRRTWGSSKTALGSRLLLPTNGTTLTKAAGCFSPNASNGHIRMSCCAVVL